jgi:hypothetical protein
MSLLWTVKVRTQPWPPSRLVSRETKTTSAVRPAKQGLEQSSRRPRRSAQSHNPLSPESILASAAGATRTPTYFRRTRHPSKRLDTFCGSSANERLDNIRGSAQQTAERDHLSKPRSGTAGRRIVQALDTPQLARPLNGASPSVRHGDSPRPGLQRGTGLPRRRPLATLTSGRARPRGNQSSDA